MKLHNWAAVCLQETWRLGVDEFYIDGYRIMLKGYSEKTNELGHVMGGVCIILNPEMDRAHKLVLNKKIAFPDKHKYEGRFIGVQLHFKKRDSHGKHIKGLIKVALCSIYHPFDSREHEDFNTTTEILLNKTPHDTKLIFGQDINCNVGTAARDDPFRGTIGPNGIKNRNRKGTKFLQHLCALDMVVANSFFIKPNYCTWKNFKPSNPLHHMLDVFSVSKSLFNRITDCGTTSFGIDNTDHTATSITININSIAIKPREHKRKTTKPPRADWTRIAQDEHTKNEFNIKLSNALHQNDLSDDYTSFFELVGDTAKATAIQKEQQAGSWFELRADTLQPKISRHSPTTTHPRPYKP